MDIGQLDAVMQHLKSKGKEFTTLQQLEKDFPDYDLVGLISALKALKR